MTDSYTAALARLVEAKVRFVLVGVGGANMHATPRQELFVTQDWDLFLPLDGKNALACWRALEGGGWKLWCGTDPLGKPLDRWLADRIVNRRALVRATNAAGLQLDLTYVMSGFDFEQVWAERRRFRSAGVEIPVARLAHIVESKRAAGRPKDILFLATHEQALRTLLAEDKESGA